MDLRSQLATIGALGALVGIPPIAASQAAPAVWTQHYDNSRTGANLQETVLNTTNVNSTTFGKLFSIPVDGSVYAQPLYVPGLTVNGTVHNVLYIATMENTLYACDADTGAVLWQKNFGTPVPASDVQCCYVDITGDVGILSTPVIDTTTNTLYLLERNKNADGTYHQWLRALDLATGADKFNSPTEIAATYGGSTFDPKVQNQRAGLTLANGNVYIAWASHNDGGDYHGWVISYSAANVSQQIAVYADTTGSMTLGGIWMSGQGLTVDGSGNLYLITGNGAFDGSTNFGDSILKLTGGLTLADYFTPSNQASLSSQDQDLGSAGVLGLPGTNYVVGGGKDGRLFLLSSASLGHFNSSTDHVVQEFQAVALNGSSTHIHGSPVYWNSPVNGPTLYVWGENDHGRAYAFGGSSFNSTAVSTTSLTAPSGMPGGILSVSANGSTAGSGILWANLPFNQNANNAVVAGELHAYDASNLGKELWNSYQNKTRDDYGNFAKFCPTVVANGKVYEATFSKQVVVYGLITPTLPAAPTNLAATAGDTTASLTWTAVSGAASYNVYRATTAGGEGTTPYKTGVTTASFQDTGLTDGTTYYYKVAAVNTVGTSALSSEASATPKTATVSPPAAPTGLTATAGDTTVSLSWTAPTGTVTGYNIYRGTATGGEETTAYKTGVTTTSFQDTGLTDDATYYYKVAAVNSAGTSPLSAEASATPKSAGTVTFTPKVGANNSAWYGEEDVVVANTAAITSLSITVTIQKTTGVSFNGQYTTIGSQIAMSHTTSTTAVTYQFTQAAGQSLGAGSWTFASQYGGTGTIHPSTGDTYSATYTSAGTTKTVTGHF
jgi:fibronectin type 3 domain-containing protein